MTARAPAKPRVELHRDVLAGAGWGATASVGRKVYAEVTGRTIPNLARLSEALLAQLHDA